MRSRAVNSGNKKIIKAILTGTVSGIVLCALLLFVSAFLFTKSGNFSHAIVQPLVLVLTGISAFASGYISARISNEKGIKYGLICSFLMFILFFIGGLIASHESITMLTLIRCLLMLLTGSIGGIIGVNKR